jgi:CP family cyanate transporter-like MFS transporter
VPVPGAGTPQSLWRGRITVLAGIAVLGLNLRAAVTTVAPLLDRVREDVAFSASSESLLAAAPPLMFALFGALAPFLGHRWGLERVVAASMGLAGAGMVARAAIVTEMEANRPGG